MYYSECIPLMKDTNILLWNKRFKISHFIVSACIVTSCLYHMDGFLLLIKWTSPIKPELRKDFYRCIYRSMLCKTIFFMICFHFEIKEMNSNTTHDITWYELLLIFYEIHVKTKHEIVMYNLWIFMKWIHSK